MIEMVTEYVVKADARGWFELAYGPGGAWSEMTDGCEGFRGTTVLRDEEDPRRYLTVDLWTSEDAWEVAVAEHEEAYAALQADFDEWLDSMVRVGIFRVLAQATVRPWGRTQPGSTRGSGRRGRRGTL